MIGALLMAALGVGLCLSPGFDALNYFSSLAVALGGSIVAGCVGARLTSRGLGAGEKPRQLLARAALAALALGGVPLALLTANALRVTNCDLWEGLAFHGVGSLGSLLFASQLGAFAALVTRRGVLLFVICWVAWCARDLWFFYTEPAIFAFNPFAGFFSGAIYDDVIQIEPRIAWYRLSNLLVVGMAWQIARMGFDPALGRVRWRGLSGAPLRLWAGLGACAIAWGTLYGLRGDLGYEVTGAYLRAQLGGRLVGERLALHYDQAVIDPVEAARLLEDATFRLDQLETVLGQRHPREIAVYVYGSPARKHALMGARRVYIAKPWLDEVHLNRFAYGDPVLHHELAHVVLGVFGEGPFRLPTAWGVFPHMGVVEGAAVAMEAPRDELTGHQWAAAMRRQGLLPPIAVLMGPEGFYAQAAGKAYTATGSFMRYLLDTHGLAKLARVYRDADFEAAYARPLGDLQRAWEGFLDGLELPPDALALATERFDQPGVLHGVCPLVIPRLEAQAARLAAEERPEDALALYRRVADFWPENPAKRVPLVEVLARLPDTGRAAAEVDAALLLPRLGAATRARLRELLADAEWRAGDTDSAVRTYAELADPTLCGEDRRRNLLVKIEVASDPEREPILGPYLLGRGEDAIEYLLDATLDLPEDPLLAYLLGRRFALEGRHPEAVAALDHALAAYAGATAPSAPLLRREAWRLLGVSLLFTGRLARAELAFETARALAERQGTREAMADWSRRVRWLSARQVF